MNISTDPSSTEQQQPPPHDVSYKIIKFFRENDQFDYRVKELALAMGYEYHVVRNALMSMLKESRIVKIRPKQTSISPTYQLKTFLTNNPQRQLEYERNFIRDDDEI